jgi:hypothetical protein
VFFYQSDVPERRPSKYLRAEQNLVQAKIWS